MVYADFSYYAERGGTILTEETANKALREASEAIDTLTYNRIVGIGFSKMTDFQQITIKNVCCDLADFQTENADLISSPLSAYTINGVSVSFSDSSTVTTENGVMIPRPLLSKLRATGLMWGVL